MSNWFDWLRPKECRAFQDIPPPLTPWAGELKSQPGFTDPSVEPAVKEPEVSYYDSVILPLYKDAEAKVVAEQPIRWREFMGRYETEYAGFSYSCERFGDFLTLRIIKLSNGTVKCRDEVFPEDRTHFSTCINLRDVKAITLREGSRVQYDSIVSYSVQIVREENELVVSYNYGADFKKPLPPGFKHKVAPNYTSRSAFSRVFVCPTDKFNEELEYLQARKALHHNGSMPNTFNTKGIARSSMEDGIVFEGIDLVVLAPYGKGKEFHNAIMQTLADGYKPEPLPIDQIQE